MWSWIAFICRLRLKCLATVSFSHHWSDLCGQCFHTAQDVYNFLVDSVFPLHRTYGLHWCIWVVEPLWQPAGAARGTKLCSVLPWKNSAFESSDPRLGQRIQGVDNFCQKVVCVCCCCCCLQQAVCAVDAIQDKFLSDEVIVLVPGSYLTGFVDGQRTIDVPSADSWPWTVGYFTTRLMGTPDKWDPRQFTTRQMGTPDISPPDKWEPQTIHHQTNGNPRVHHQTNGNPRQFTTRQMGTPGNSPLDKWEPQFTTSSILCDESHTHACMSTQAHMHVRTHTHTHACMYTHAHTHTCMQKHTHTGELSQVIIYFSGEWSTLLPLASLPLLFTCNRKGAGAVSVM